MIWLISILTFVGGLFLGMNLVIWYDIIKLRAGKRLAELDLELSKILKDVKKKEVKA